MLRVFEQTPTPTALSHRCERLDERERAFAQRLAYGAVQRVRTLDHAIDTLGKRPVRKLDPPVRAALRLGAYQLGYSTARAARRGERVGRARAPRAASSAPSRSRTPSCAGSPRASRALLDGAPDGPLKESYPDWIAETSGGETSATTPRSS